MSESSEPILTLTRLRGPALDDEIEVTATGRFIIGRSRRSTFLLNEPTVSRSHCELMVEENGDIFLLDLGSRHGTLLNGVPLTQGNPAALRAGDVVSIGPWLFRVSTTDDSGNPTEQGTLIDMPTATASRVEAIANRDLMPLPTQRLEYLLNSAEQIHAATDEDSLAHAVLDALLHGTGYQRAALLRVNSQADDEVEVVARAPFGSDRDERGELRFSRSLIRVAATGETARLVQHGNTSGSSLGHSLIDTGVQSAMCVPVMIGDIVDCLIYADAPREGLDSRQDASAFCVALSRLCALAIGNMRRQSIERRHQHLEFDLKTAREAQQLMMPPKTGAVGPVQYAVHIEPGRYVAGDLFDVVRIDDRRVGVFLGDVAGKGVGAAMLMSMSQAILREHVQSTGDPAFAVQRLNASLIERPSRKFISLWVGVFDGETDTLSFVDAGHGYCLIRPPGGTAEQLRSDGGPLVGVMPDFKYICETIPIKPGTRIVTFSDGVVEQTGLPEADSVEEEQFGFERARQVIAESTTPEEDVRTLLESVRTYAGQTELADDTSITSIEFVGQAWDTD